MDDQWQWLKVTAALTAVVTVIWKVQQYLSQKRQELRLQKFKVYHGLIRDLVEPDQTGNTYLDRQLAVVFELRRFPAYFEASLGILRGLHTTWSKEAKYSRLMDEMDVTIAVIEKKSKNWWHRLRQWFRDFSTY